MPGLQAVSGLGQEAGSKELGTSPQAIRVMRDATPTAFNPAWLLRPLQGSHLPWGSLGEGRGRPLLHEEMRS